MILRWYVAALWLPLLAPGGLALQDPVPDPGPQTVAEPGTGIEFPVELSVLDGEEKHLLAGTGVRMKNILNQKVYAIGLYVHGEGVRKGLKEWQESTVSKNKKEHALFQELLESDFNKSLRLVMARDIEGDYLREAFVDILEPRVAQKAAGNSKMKDGPVALKELRTYFKMEELKEGTEIIFTWEKSGKLSTFIKGHKMGELKSNCLSWALFDLFLGRRPLSQKAKKSLVKRLPEILKPPKKEEEPASDDAG